MHRLSHKMEGARPIGTAIEIIGSVGRIRHVSAASIRRFILQSSVALNASILSAVLYAVGDSHRRHSPR